MASLGYLNSQRQLYLQLRGSMNEVVSQLGSCIQTIEPATEISNHYTIDGLSADGKIIVRQKDELLSAKAKAESIISSIDSEIQKIENEIAEEERRIAEEEERKAREAAMAQQMIYYE